MGHILVFMLSYTLEVALQACLCRPFYNAIGLLNNACGMLEQLRADTA